MAISTEEMRARQAAAQGEETKIAQAIQEVTDRAQLLIREELELAKAEISEKVAQLVRGAIVAIAAGVFIVVGMLFVLHGFAWLTWDLLFTGTNYFWGFFIVAGVLFLLGALAGFLASRAFKRGAPPTPQLAIDEAKKIRDTVQSDHPEQTI
jgi:uncharacterized membrane protein YqjE